jgi:hypothetical protein
VKPDPIKPANAKAFVLQAIRSTWIKVKQIETDLQTAAKALEGDLIDIPTALEWAEEVAPGCLPFIPECISRGGDK